MLNTGNLPKGAKGSGSRQGKPQRNFPNTSGGGGEGVVVGGRESRPHDGQEESKKTPMAKALSFPPFSDAEVAREQEKTCGSVRNAEET